MPGLSSICHRRYPLLFITLGALVLSATPGCGILGQPSESGPVFGLIGVLGDQTGPDHVEEAGGNDFASPEPIAVSEGGTAIIQGSIEESGDADVFDLGPLSIGDRVLIETATDAGLDAAAALFDGQENLIVVSDDRYFGAGGDRPFINVVSRRFTDNCLLAVSSSPRKRTTGGYTASVTVERFAEPVEDRPQVIALDFDGQAGVRVGGRDHGTLPPFDATFIDPSYAGRTAEMIEAVLAYVQQDFAGLNVEVYVSGDPAIPGGEITSVYFGSYDANLLGLADYVDVHNANPRQSGIVYTGTFALFMRLNPSVERMAQALANVASHEAGHLLGLNHTRDPLGIMDITATAYELLQDQDFRRSPLEPSIFPIGWQDGFGQLLETVGGGPISRRLSAAPLGPQGWVEPLDADDPLMTEPLRKCGFEH